MAPVETPGAPQKFSAILQEAGSHVWEVRAAAAEVKLVKPAWPHCGPRDRHAFGSHVCRQGFVRGWKNALKRLLLCCDDTDVSSLFTVCDAGPSARGGGKGGGSVNHSTSGPIPVIRRCGVALTQTQTRKPKQRQYLRAQWGSDRGRGGRDACVEAQIRTRTYKV